MKLFPQPLCESEEYETLKRCKDGDKSARELLIERNLRLVAHIARKYNFHENETDDLISIGTIGLIKAIDTFNPDKGIRLATYAARCIDNELLMMLRSNKKKSREILLYDSIGTDKEGNEICLLDILEAVEDEISEKLENDELSKQIPRLIKEKLSFREQEIIKMRYGLGGIKDMTQREIADKYGISRSYVSRIEKKALGKLREGLEG